MGSGKTLQLALSSLRACIAIDNGVDASMPLDYWNEKDFVPFFCLSYLA